MLLGDIAKNAYLPVLSKKEGIELVLCTRNLETVNDPSLTPFRVV
jgi:virulence factor